MKFNELCPKWTEILKQEYITKAEKTALKDFSSCAVWEAWGNSYDYLEKCWTCSELAEQFFNLGIEGLKVKHEIVDPLEDKFARHYTIKHITNNKK